MLIRLLLVAGLTIGVEAIAGDPLEPDKLALLQDGSGWEYVSMDDSHNGFPKQHACFDGTPHPDACSGILTFTKQNTFTQKVTIHGQTVARQGSYKLSGNQVSFYDEFGTPDGPYTIEIDSDKKQMSMNMPQVKVRLMLYREYRKQLDALKHKKQ
jgi:hypothetical protein